MNTNKGDVIKAIILTIAAVGAVTALAIVAPNAIGAFANLVGKGRGKYNKKQINRGLAYLKQKKIIGIGKDNSGNTIVKLSEAGKERLLKYKLEDMVLPKQKKWDRKWRVVVFDIPEKFKLNRDTLTEKLKSLGFYQMQKSAWIWPYPVEDEVTFLKEVYEIRPFATLVTAEKIENDFRYLRHFSLYT